jgi:alginate O-acetyltransferase complex protein AlgJ
VLASPNHWRRLTATLVVLMAAAFLAPKWIPAPGIQENRVLATKPAWPTGLKDFKAFRQASDAYVADHFPIRPHLIGLLNFARMTFGVSGSNRVIVGRGGWLFYDDDSHLGSARNVPPVTPAESRAWLATLAGRTEAARAAEAAYLVVSPPMKEVIYPGQTPSWFGGVSPDRPAVTLAKLAAATKAGEVLYLGPDLAAATRAGQKTFSRHDTHWSGYGAYAGYVGLMRRLKAMGAVQDDPRPLSSFPKIELHGIYQPRDLALMLGVSSFVRLDYPNFGNPEAEKKIRTTYLTARHDWTSPQVIDTGAVGKPVLFMTRDSFSNEMLPFLYPHFSRIILIHIQDGTWRPDLIARYKPDIVLLEVLEASLRIASADGPPPSAEALARIDGVLSVGPAQPGQPPVPTLAPDAKLLAALDAAKPAPGCNLEAASLAFGVDGATALKVSGWISELGPTITAPRGVVRLRGPAGDMVGSLRVDLPRPDVAAYFKMPTAEKSGFIATHQAGTLPKGDYKAVVYRRSVDGWIVCNGVQTLTAP